MCWGGGGGQRGKGRASVVTSDRKLHTKGFYGLRSLKIPREELASERDWDSGVLSPAQASPRVSSTPTGT